MNLRRLFTFTLLLGSALTAVAHAQTAPAAGAGLSARIKVLSMQSQVSGVDIVLGSGKRLPISASAEYISKSYVYQGPAKLVLMKSLAAKPAGAADAPAAANASGAQTAVNATVSATTKAELLKGEVLATIDLPATGGDFLLLFSGDTNTKLQVMALPFSSADVPASSCLVWNITSRNLGFSLGGQKAVLAAGQHEVIKPSSAVKNYYDLKIFDEFQGRARPLIGGAHFLPENSRQLLFIVEKTPGQSPILVRTIEEFPEKQEKKPAAELAMSR